MSGRGAVYILSLIHISEVDGKKTDLFTLRNKNNMEVCITNFGGRIVSVMVPDKDGVMQDVVLGFDSIQDYICLLYTSERRQVIIKHSARKYSQGTKRNIASSILMITMKIPAGSSTMTSCGGLSAWHAATSFLEWMNI